MNLLAAEQRGINPTESGTGLPAGRQALKTAFGELKENIGLYKVFYFRIAKIISY
jgi:hypothetical protein